MTTRTRQHPRAPAPDPLGPCRDGCDPATISKVGSNAQFTRETCLVCGHVRKTPKTTRKFSPSACTREHVDHRGSSKTVHRTFCLDCETCVNEVPQSEHRRSLDIARDVENAPVRLREAISRLTDEASSVLSSAQAVQSAAFSVGSWLDYPWKLELSARHLSRSSTMPLTGQ